MGGYYVSGSEGDGARTAGVVVKVFTYLTRFAMRFSNDRFWPKVIVELRR